MMKDHRIDFALSSAARGFLWAARVTLICGMATLACAALRFLDPASQENTNSASPAPSVSATPVTVFPASATVNVADNTLLNAGTQQFSAKVREARDQQVKWELCSRKTCYPAGTWSQYGSLSNSGAYTAPLVLPKPTTFTIKAISQQDPANFGSATITVSRNVHWTVTSAPSSASAPVNWPSLIATPGDKTVYYHLFHNGIEERCRPNVNAGFGPCYREVLFHIGRGFVANGTKGGILYFHGAGGSSADCGNILGGDWNAEVDRHGWVAACPQGALNKGGKQSWNGYWPASGGVHQPLEASPDDSALAWAILSDFSANLHLDPKRNHLTGQSAGTMFESRVIAEDGALVASASQAPGNTYGTDHDVCHGGKGLPCNPTSNYPQAWSFPPLNLPTPQINYPVSVFIMMGTDDAYTSDCSGPAPGTLNNAPNLGESFDFYAKMFHCSKRTPNEKPFCPYVAGQSPTCQKSNFVAGEGRGCRRSSESYKHATGCDEGVVVYAYRMFGGQHQSYNNIDISNSRSPAYNTQLRADFPNSTPPRGTGYENDIIWDFFNQHPQP
jgi:poly(3-hydroxybutyrate) depolymerase